jgi:AcrR family transcriptional regulator
MVNIENRPRGRPREFNHDEALDKAMHVFWERGYEGASLAELIDALGINKPSLYAAFGNKEELFRKALARYSQREVAYVGESMRAPTARQAAEAFLTKSAEFLADDGHPKGCMIVQGALSCSEDATKIHQTLICHRNEYEDLLRKRFVQAQNEGDLSKDANAAELAKYIATVHQGMSVQATSGASKEELMSVVNQALRTWPT